MVWKLFSFWEGPFSGVMLVSGSLRTIKSVYFHQTWKKPSSFSKSFNGFSGALLIFFSVLVCCSSCKSCPLVSICFSSNSSNFCTACVERDQAAKRVKFCMCFGKSLGNLGEMFTLYNISVTNSSYYMNNIIKKNIMSYGHNCTT